MIDKIIFEVRKTFRLLEKEIWQLKENEVLKETINFYKSSGHDESLGNGYQG
jgi:hypothetical protein